MRKLLILTAVFLVLGLMSCNNLIDRIEHNGELEVKDTKKAYLALDLQASARTILPNVDLSELTDLVLEGDLQGTTTSHLKQSFANQTAAASTPIIIEPGTWNFTLTAKKGTATFKGVLAEKEIVEGENTLSFAMDLYSVGEGTNTGFVSFTLTLPMNSGVKDVQVGLFDIDTDAEIADFGFDSSKTDVLFKNNKLTYTATDVPIGTYRLKVLFYADDAYIALVNTYREIVSVADGLVSSAERTIDNLNEVYTITYEMNDGVFSSAYAAPESYSRNSEFLLATAKYITKKGYAFVGWYESEDFSTARVTNVTKNTSGIKTYYAKWAQGCVVTSNTLSELDLSDKGEGYTVAVVGDLDFSVLAEKLKAASNTVALDLFAATAITFSDDVFKNCTKLCSVVLPENLTKIGAEAFLGCSSLESFAVTAAVVSIGANAFGNCAALQEITVADTNTTYKAIDGILFSKDGAKLLQYPAGKTDISYTIGAGVTDIASTAFNGCTALQAFTVADDNETYDDISGILYSYDEKTLIRYPAGRSDSTFNLPAKVTTIADYAFYGCEALTAITTTNSKLATIGAYAFAGCSALETFEIPASVTTVGGNAFDDSLITGYYTVTFETNGGSSIASISVRGGLALVSLKLQQSKDILLAVGIVRAVYTGRMNFLQRSMQIRRFMRSGQLLAIQ